MEGSEEINYLLSARNGPSSTIGVMLAQTITTMPCNGTNCSTTTVSAQGSLLYGVEVTAILAILAAITSFTTTIGNMMVIISFIMERSIRQASNYLIVSLAVTDVLIGALSMPLYTLYLLKNTWPLGQLLCDLWLSLDYTVCLVSQYTVFLITLDRFCSVKVPARYRNWRTENKIKLMIGLTWFLPAAIFFTSIMGWRSFTGDPLPDTGVCMAQFQNNKLFSAILVISYYWITLVVMIGLYAGIYQVALSLQKRTQAVRNRIKKAELLNGNSQKSYNTMLSDKQANHTTLTPQQSSESDKGKATRPESFKSLPTAIPPAVVISDCVDSDTHTRQLSPPSQNLDAQSPVWKPRTSLPDTSINWDAFSGKIHVTMVPSPQQENHSNSNGNGTIHSSHQSLRAKVSNRTQLRVDTARLPSTTSSFREDETMSETSDSDPIPNGRPRVLTQLTSLISNISPKMKRKSSYRRKSKSENRAKKALRTITFILGAFVVCWTPYHVAVLVDSFCPKGSTCLNGVFYSFSYWLCYMNSPINPFCYALANQQFKKSFIKILKFEYVRNYFKNR